ncbi:MAG: MFS transporter [Sandarakinorhabdus sp.]|nr:MFS transporter [Sandarakinorhabdus sp.]
MTGMPTADQTKRLSAAALLLYALPNLPHSLALLPVVNFLPAFYADDLGLPLGLVGLMLFLSRLADIVIDPVVGIWSDRTRSRLGRRRPFIIAGLPIICVAVWLAFVPAPGVGLPYLFWCLFFIYLGFSVIDLPYSSWGADMTADYDERSRVSAVRAASGTIGSLVALSIPLLLTAIGRPGSGEALYWMAIFFVITQPLAFAVMMALLPEPEPGPTLATRPSLGRGLALIARNAAFVRLNIALMLILAGMVVGASLNLIVMTHVIGAPQAFPLMVFLQNIVALIGIPFWTRVAARHGKHIAMSLGGLWIAACLALSFVWTRGDTTGFVATIVALGFGMGGLMFLAQAMIADIADRDTLDSGEERTGTFFAFLGVTTKIAIAVGVLIGTGVPALIGFQPSDPFHTAGQLLGLRAVYAFSAAPLILTACWLLWHYPLTREVQAATRSEILSRRRAVKAGPHD